MSWTLVTAPDERERCCVVEGGQRCEQGAEFEIRGASGAPDDYAYTCAGHVKRVAVAGDLILLIAEPRRRRTETPSSQSRSQRRNGG